MTRLHQGTALVCLAFALFVAGQARALQLYTSMGPGPGFFPFWLAVLLALLAVAMFAQASFGPPLPRPPDLVASRAGYARVAAILGALVGTVVCLERLGFRLTFLAFHLFLLATLSRQSWWVVVLLAVAGSFGVYHLFTDLLGIALPVGPFGI